MLKLLLLVIVIGVFAWMITSRRRPPPGARGAGENPRVKPKAQARAAKVQAAQPMLACAHCGMHLPQSEALADADGKVYCSDAHRLAGPHR